VGRIVDSLDIAAAEVISLEIIGRNISGA